jgi:uncharacterized protein (DUF58 family)
MFLSQTELNMLSSLRLQPRTKMRGQPLSDLRSLDLGAGLEFADYRQYVAGDDIRRLDWHQYQKHDKLVVRQYEQHEVASFNLLMDLSDSVVCCGPQKVLSIKKICAAYGFVILKHGYKLALWPAANTLSLRRFSSPSQWLNFIEHIDTMHTGGKIEITDVIGKFGQRAGIAQNVIVVSDLICSRGFDHLKNVLSRDRHNYILVHLYGQAEINPSFTGDLILTDSELGADQLTNVNNQNIAKYKQNYTQYYEDIRKFASGSGCFYCDVLDELALADQIKLLAPDGIMYL